MKLVQILYGVSPPFGYPCWILLPPLTGISLVIRCSCTQLAPACGGHRAQGLPQQQRRPSSLSVLALGSSIAPSAAHTLGRAHLEMTTWLVRLTVSL